ncbi:enolase C-terminal domain-like protein (plasmid) [Rhizobium sp. CB3090]|uniref:enolase C-terminal domain-like protein n=1 Tax=Rhizobium sp. CB3090 TaxID=3039156 RepID=UPI0024B0CB51|nr:enolase C-terminal domain-like protein [Rhizobium sp. CB3090]WFU11695.1 enolase C-terminal domain-like protein [Rhizobium sp. CB3090]
MTSSPSIDRLECATYKIPTDAPEGDGTFEWDSTTMVLVQIWAGSHRGIGYTYADAAAAGLVATLKDAVIGSECFDIPSIHKRLASKVRNSERSGIAACAISAIDVALWDLKARCLDLPLFMLLGAARKSIPVYGSGGFTTYSDKRLRDQLSAWIGEDGCHAVKMKIGADAKRDPGRIAVARDAIGEAELFIDANGAFTPQSAVRFASVIKAAGVRWFEEPVSSDDEAGLNFVRHRTPASMEIAAGEYIYTLDDARHLIEAKAIDVLQADVTRCGGISGFLKISALCEAFHIDLSGHCAPSVHLHVACGAAWLRHLEWFHDHVRIEQMLFEGAPAISGGMIKPDPSQRGNGLEFKFQDAEKFKI